MRRIKIKNRVQIRIYYGRRLSTQGHPIKVTYQKDSLVTGLTQDQKNDDVTPMDPEGGEHREKGFDC